MDRFLIAGNDANTDTMATVALRCGYEVCLAPSDADFRTLLRRFAPTVVALDLTNPNVDGIELLGIAANDSSKPAILLVTAYDERVTAAAERVGLANDLMMVGRIAKPVSPAPLRTLLNGLKLPEPASSL